jgi:hypothetical protein
MNDQNNNNDIPSNEAWNDVPEQPMSPEEPIIPEHNTEPEESAQETEKVEPVPVSEVIPEVVFHSEPEPAQSAPFVYDPVLDESEPYIDVTPKNEGFKTAPAVDPSIAKPPADDKKTTGWVIALIVILLLCLCICCGVMVVTMMIASGEYRLDFSSLLSPVFSMLRFF